MNNNSNNDIIIVMKKNYMETLLITKLTHSIMYITRVCRCHSHSITYNYYQSVSLPPYFSTQFWVCRCHPYCMHFMGCVAATLVLPQGAPNNL